MEKVEITEEKVEAVLETVEEKVETVEEVVETKVEAVEPVVETKVEEVVVEETVAEKPESQDENFEQMLEESLVNIKDPKMGDKVEGKISNITDQYIFVNLGGKRDAYSDRTDFTDKEGNLTVEVGQTLSGYVVRTSETETLIAKSLVSVNISVLKEAFDEKIPVAGKVKTMIKGGYLIDISGVRAFCPHSQIDNKLVIDPKVFINQAFDFRVIDFKDNGKNIVVSRRQLLEEERSVKKKETLAKLAIDEVVKGKVTRLTNFGAFIDLGGVEGLLHISEFSWVRVDSPSEMLSIGDEIDTKVIKLDGERISLSMKSLQENPFDVAIKDLNVGDVVNCRVLRNLPFGSFVEIKAGVEGLIPISELSRGRHIKNPSEVITEGEMVEAQILKIDPDSRKISLSLKALQSDPWDEIHEFFSENEVVDGVIENVASFGVFINIKDGVTGLMPSAKVRLGNLNISSDNIGQVIAVRIFKIDSEAKRISLEPTDLPERAPGRDRDENHGQKEDWKSFKKNTSKKQQQVMDEDNPFSIL